MCEDLRNYACQFKHVPLEMNRICHSGSSPENAECVAYTTKLYKFDEAKQAFLNVGIAENRIGSIATPAEFDSELFTIDLQTRLQVEGWNTSTARSPWVVVDGESNKVFVLDLSSKTKLEVNKNDNPVARPVICRLAPTHQVGSTEFDNKIYEFITEKETYDDARLKCRARGIDRFKMVGSLVRIHGDSLFPTDLRLFLGDEMKKLHWNKAEVHPWVDYLRATQFKCGVWYNEASNQSSSASCEDKLEYICEYSKMEVKCDVEGDGKCYGFISEPLGLVEAENNCKKYSNGNGRLVEDLSPVRNNFLVKVMEDFQWSSFDDFWIGLGPIDEQKNVTYASSPMKVITDNALWAASGSNRFISWRVSAQVSNGRWKGVSSNQAEKPSVCEIDPELSEMECMASGTCFLFSTKNQTRKEANTLCMKYGLEHHMIGFLAEPRDTETSAFIKASAAKWKWSTNGIRTWLGISRVSSSEFFYLSESDSGTHHEYSNWKDSGTGSTVVDHFGEWYRASSSKHPALCQLSRTEIVKCPTDSSSCYAFVTMPKTSLEAPVVCQTIATNNGKATGSLVQLKDALLTKYLVSEMKKLQWKGNGIDQTLKNNPWIGVHGISNRAYFGKHNQKIIGYSNWMSSVNYPMSSWRATIDPATGQWDQPVAENSINQAPFICELADKANDYVSLATCNAITSQNNIDCGCGFERDSTNSFCTKSSYLDYNSLVLHYLDCALSFQTTNEKFARGLRRVFDCGGPFARLESSRMDTYLHVERKQIVLRLLAIQKNVGTTILKASEIVDLEMFSKHMDVDRSVHSSLCVNLCSVGQTWNPSNNKCEPPSGMRPREFTEYARSLVACEASATQSQSKILYESGTHLLLALTNVAVVKYVETEDLIYSVIQDIGATASWTAGKLVSNSSLLSTVSSLVREFILRQGMAAEALNEVPKYSSESLLKDGGTNTMSIRKLELNLKQAVNDYKDIENKDLLKKIRDEIKYNTGELQGAIGTVAFGVFDSMKENSMASIKAFNSELDESSLDVNEKFNLTIDSIRITQRQLALLLENHDLGEVGLLQDVSDASERLVNATLNLEKAKLRRGLIFGVFKMIAAGIKLVKSVLSFGTSALQFFRSGGAAARVINLIGKQLKGSALKIAGDMAANSIILETAALDVNAQLKDLAETIPIIGEIMEIIEAIQTFANYKKEVEALVKTAEEDIQHIKVAIQSISDTLEQLGNKLTSMQIILLQTMTWMNASDTDLDIRDTQIDSSILQSTFVWELTRVQIMAALTSDDVKLCPKGYETNPYRSRRLLLEVNDNPQSEKLSVESHLQVRQYHEHAKTNEFMDVLSVKSAKAEAADAWDDLDRNCSEFAVVLDRFTKFGAASQDMIFETIRAIRGQIVLKKRMEALQSHKTNWGNAMQKMSTLLKTHSGLNPDIDEARVRLAQANVLSGLFPVSLEYEAEKTLLDFCRTIRYEYPTFRFSRESDGVKINTDTCEIQFSSKNSIPSATERLDLLRSELLSEGSGLVSEWKKKYPDDKFTPNERRSCDMAQPRFLDQLLETGDAPLLISSASFKRSFNCLESADFRYMSVVFKDSDGFTIPLKEQVRLTMVTTNSKYFKYTDDKMTEKIEFQLTRAPRELTFTYHTPIGKYCTSGSSMNLEDGSTICYSRSGYDDDFSRIPLYGEWQMKIQGWPQGTKAASMQLLFGDMKFISCFSEIEPQITDRGFLCGRDDFRLFQIASTRSPVAPTTPSVNPTISPVTSTAVPTKSPVTPTKSPVAGVVVPTKSPTVPIQSASPTTAPANIVVQLGQRLDGDTLNGRFGQSIAISSDGSRLVVGSPFDKNIDGSRNGLVKIYEWHTFNKEWIQIAPQIDGQCPGFGASVSLSADGKRMVIGSLNSKDNSGCVIAYAWDELSSLWNQLGKRIYVNEGKFGHAVSISDDGMLFAVGSPKYDGGRGSVNVYSWSEGAGCISKGTPIYGTNPDERCGHSVSLSADGMVLFVGAPYHNLRGLLNVFQWNGDVLDWDSYGNSISGGSDHELFGSSVSAALDGSMVVVGAPSNGLGSGCTRVYKYNTGSFRWVQQGQDLYGRNFESDFGTSVAISWDGTRVISSSPYTRAGALLVYDWIERGLYWIRTNEVVEPEGGLLRFGFAASLSQHGQRIAIGAPLSNKTGVFSGSAQVFAIPALNATLASSETQTPTSSETQTPTSFASSLSGTLSICWAVLLFQYY